MPQIGFTATDLGIQTVQTKLGYEKGMVFPERSPRRYCKWALRG
jgi:hypothetical protein